MKKISILTTLIIALFFTSCNRERPCPEEMDLGEIRLEEETLDLLYDMTDQLVFRNTVNNEEMRFVPNLNVNNFNGEQLLSHPCLQTRYNINVSYRPERISRRFVSEDETARISLIAETRYARNGDKLLGSPFDDILFYDTYTYLLNFDDGQNSYIGFVASDKGNDLNFDSFNFGVEANPIVINGEFRENIYYDVESESFFSREERIIGFERNGEYWVLDRVE